MSRPPSIDPKVPLRTYHWKVWSPMSTEAVVWGKRVTPKISPSKSRLVSVAKGSSDWAMLANWRSSSSASSLAEDKARARTVARAQAVAEELSSAANQVSSAIAEATGAVEELEKTMHTIAAGAEEASAAADESRAAINQRRLRTGPTVVQKCPCEG